MKQIIQNIRSGKLSVTDVPEPALQGPGVLVATQCSAVSAGTERMITEFAEKGLIGKARSRPKDVRKVLDKIKRDGLRAAIQSAMARLDHPMPLGYSMAGYVLTTSPEVTEVKPGDRVACGGANYAVHAEVDFVPRNLVVPIPDNVDFTSASFTTLGSVAMQGIRVADLEIGETVAVIGLGLLGLITVQLARAAGCRVIGADINPSRFELATKLGCERVCPISGLRAGVAEMTRNTGVDAVIVTAATASNEPIEVAADIARKKGRISMVGAVKMDLPRTPFYQKELQLRLSCSYGPGRYDSVYEEKGIDYPSAYVPWTEQRNMRCLVDLMSQGKLDMQSLITHRFPIEEAEKAYDLIKGHTVEPYLGIVLTYPEVETRTRTPSIHLSATARTAVAGGRIGIGCIGAGNFATVTMLPKLKDIPEYRFVALAERDGRIGRHAAEKFGFERAVTDHQEVMKDEKIGLVFVTTRHDAHAPLLLEALKAGKHVMVEKPLCLNEDQLRTIIDAVEGKPEKMVMVGFNRRFAPMAVELKHAFTGKGPYGIHYICNAGFSPKESWVHDPEIGGGRLLGEGCHFVDWMVWFTGAAPVRVYAQSMGRETGANLTDDNLMVSLQFQDGSIGTVSYLACGDTSYTKEHIQVFGGGCIGIIDDFRRGTFTARGATRKLAPSPSKGHFEEWQAVARALTEGKPAPISFAEIVCSTWATLKAVESLRCGEAIDLK